MRHCISSSDMRVEIKYQISDQYSVNQIKNILARGEEEGRGGGRGGGRKRRKRRRKRMDLSVSRLKEEE